MSGLKGLKLLWILEELSLFCWGKVWLEGVDKGLPVCLPYRVCVCWVQAGCAEIGHLCCQMGQLKGEDGGLLARGRKLSFDMVNLLVDVTQESFPVCW